MYSAYSLQDCRQQPLYRERRFFVPAIVVTFLSLIIGGPAGSKYALAANPISHATTHKPALESTNHAQTKSHQRVRLKIYVPCRAWVPKNVQPKVVLLCVHGIGLNSASYDEFGKQMQQQGIGCFAVDVRGFGTWMRLKGKEKCDFKACLGRCSGIEGTSYRLSRQASVHSWRIDGWSDCHASGI